MYKINFYIKPILGFILLSVTSYAFAEFSVEDKSWPKQLPESEYGPHNYYGNSKSHSYMYTENPGEMTKAEEETILSMLPESEFNRWYIKGGIYSSSVKLKSVKNKSNGVLNNSTVDSPTESKDKKTFLLGFGYSGKTWRYDFEYISKQSIDYNPNPLFTGRAEVLTSNISNKGIIGNFYYDFREFYIFKPFVGFSAGLGMNKVKSKLTGGIGNSLEESNSRISLAFGGQFGVKSRIFSSNAFIGASYRYLSLGGVKWSNKTTNANVSSKLEGSLVSSGISIDFTYLL